MIVDELERRAIVEVGNRRLTRGDARLALVPTTGRPWTMSSRPTTNRSLSTSRMPRPRSLPGMSTALVSATPRPLKAAPSETRCRSSRARSHLE